MGSKKKAIGVPTAVDPLRNIDDIEKMKDYLLRKNYRDYFLFFIGINSGLRISDILKLRVKDVRGKTHVRIREKKTGNYRSIFLNEVLKAEINKYTKNMADSDFLFPSKKDKSNPITRIAAYQMLNKAAAACNIEGNIGTHSMKKSFGYHHYKQFHDVALLQTIFGHAAPSITLRYIGITQDEIDNSYNSFSL